MNESTYNPEDIFLAENLVFDIVDFYVGSAVFADQNFVTLLYLEGNIISRVVLFPCT